MPKTVSICIPSSCIQAPSCASLQQATHVAHQIARAAIFCQVDEIIVYDPCDPVESSSSSAVEPAKKKIVFGEEEDHEVKSQPEPVKQDMPAGTLLASLLQFFVTPSYLRRITFPDTRIFEYAKKLPKIPGLPFMNHSKARYLEGITVKHKIDKKTMAKFKKGSTKSKKQLALESSTHKVQVGDDLLLNLDPAQQKVPVGMRVTVDTDKKRVVSARTAYGSEYFGYGVRVATHFGKVFTQCPLSADGYSYTVYVPCQEFLAGPNVALPAAVKGLATANPSNLRRQGATSTDSRILLVYGRWNQVDRAVGQDSEDLAQVTDAKALFDARLAIRSCGRVEDAVMMSLSKLDMQ